MLDTKKQNTRDGGLLVQQNESQNSETPLFEDKFDIVMDERTSLLPFSRKGAHPDLSINTGSGEIITDDTSTSAGAPTPPKHRNTIKIIVLLAVLFIVLSFVSAAMTTVSLEPFESDAYPSLSRIYISTHKGKYLRTHPSSDRIVATETIPWLYGSSFEIHMPLEGSKCWTFRSYSNRYIAIRHDSTIVTTDVPADAACFEVYKGSGIVTNGVSVAFKLFGSSKWMSISLSDSTYLELAAHSQNSNFVISHTLYLRGVNLGGYFIPEYWMTPNFYANTSIGWGGSLCTIVAANATLAKFRMLDHLATFITESDFSAIALSGINAIRIPIGYWNIISDPYHYFTPPLPTSLHYLDWIMRMAEKYNLLVVIDIHGGPMSQNGADHSGCSSSTDTGYGNNNVTRDGSAWLHNKNIRLTLAAIEAVMKRYGNNSAFYGIELLNEPSLAVESRHDKLLQFYEDAYEIIRRYSKTALVIINELHDINYHTWDTDLLEPYYYNVVMDYHLYHWQEPYTSNTVAEHIAAAASWKDLIRKNNRPHPIVVGEWSMSSGKINPAGQPFVTSQLQSFREGVGWFAWTWKVERNIGFDDWDVSYQLQKPNGLRLDY